MLDDAHVTLTFVAPSRSKWKWGQRYEGVYSWSCILTKVKPPVSESGKSKLMDITPNEHMKVQELYQKYTSK